MEHAVILAKAADEHPTASLVLGVIVVVALVGALWWLVGKVFK